MNVDGNVRIPRPRLNGWLGRLVELSQAGEIGSDWTEVEEGAKTAAYQQARDVAVAQALVRELGEEGLLDLEVGSTFEPDSSVFVVRARSN